MPGNVSMSCLCDGAPVVAWHPDRPLTVLVRFAGHEPEGAVFVELAKECDGDAFSSFSAVQVDGEQIPKSSYVDAARDGACFATRPQIERADLPPELAATADLWLRASVDDLVVGIAWVRISDT